jgi:uncharacterized membrane protein
MTPVIAIHLATVLPAFLIGTWLIFFSEKGARWHRAVGALYLALMFATAIVTLFVREIDPGRLSWVHYVFVPLTLYSIVAALWGIKMRNIARHRGAMVGLYVGIIAAGGAAFLPGRLLYRTFIG